jgi:hypothetical protein
MEQREKGPNFLNEAINRMYGIVDEARDTEELKEVLTYLLTEKLKESFKNGLEVGRKQQPGAGQTRRPERSRRRYRR